MVVMSLDHIRDYFTNFHTPLVDWAHASALVPVVPFCTDPAVPACP